MVVMVCVQVAEFIEVGCFDHTVYYVGHLVGEYVVLFVVFGALLLELVVCVVYECGLIMYRFVVRDVQGWSLFVMVVICLYKVGVSEE